MDGLSEALLAASPGVGVGFPMPLVLAGGTRLAQGHRR